MGILLDKFDKPIGEHGSAAVRADHIALLRQQLEIVEKQVEKLEAENIALKETVRACEEKLVIQSRGDEFVEHLGALFKRKSGGGYHEAVYCPKCRCSTFSANGGRNVYACSCEWKANFGFYSLQRVMNGLP